MTLKQKLFIQEYLVDFNGSGAARRVGYSPKTAYSIGQRLLKNVEIQSEIQKTVEERTKRANIKAENVLKELALIGFADMKDYVEIDESGAISLKPFTDMPEGASKAVSKVKEKRRILTNSEGDGKEIVVDITTSYSHHDKVKALEIIGRHLGMWKDKQEVTFPDNETFVLPKLAVPDEKPATNLDSGGNGSDGNGGSSD